MAFQLSFRVNLAANAQLVLSSRLLQLPAVELQELLRRELAENPALERLHWPGPAVTSEPDYDDRLEQFPACPTAQAQLEAQLRLLSGEGEREVAIYLLHCLNEHGYLEQQTADIAADLGISVERVEQGLRALQRLEPPGLGARDLRECLLLQCRHLGDAGSEGAVARRILQEAWDDSAAQRWAAVARRLHISRAELDAARLFIRRRLYPYPLLLLPGDGVENATFRQADLVIRRERTAGGYTGYVLELPGESTVALQISASFTEARQAELSPGERAWIDEHVQRARLLINAVAQRWQTLRCIGDFLIAEQQEFLDRGPLYLKPLTRAEVASALALHPSTVGRAVRDKVVQLPDGQLTLLKDFFDDSLAAKAAIRRLVTQAAEPLSDGVVAQQLAQQGIQLARRTVTKYRKQLGIPAAQSRYQSAGETL